MAKRKKEIKVKEPVRIREKLKIKNARREFLTVEELKILISTPCRCDTGHLRDSVLVPVEFSISASKDRTI